MIPGWLRVVLFLALLVALVAMQGCGSERTEQQNTVEQEVWEFGPMDVETPAGNVRIHKTGVVRKMSRYRTTTETKEYTFPEAREIGGAMLGGLGGPLAGGGIVGIAMAWLMKRASTKNAAEKSELEAEQARDRKALEQTVAGVERAKADMSPAEIDILHNNLSKTMDASAKARVRIAKAKV